MGKILKITDIELKEGLFCLKSSGVPFIGRLSDSSEAEHSDRLNFSVRVPF